jgi:serine/threonine protein kinase
MSSSSSSNVVGVHYRVGKKIGEGSFGVIFEGTNLLNNQQVAIKFVRVILFVLLSLIGVVFMGYTDKANFLGVFCEVIGTTKERCTTT